jgi:hypothetical protein
VRLRTPVFYQCSPLKDLPILVTPSFNVDPVDEALDISRLLDTPSGQDVSDASCGVYNVSKPLSSRHDSST